MKKYLFLMLVASLFCACTSDNNDCDDQDSLEQMTNSGQEKEIEQKKPCLQTGHTTIPITNSNYTLGHSQRTFGDTIINIYCPQSWRLDPNQNDTIYVEIQLPKNTKVKSLTKSNVVSGTNCNNDYLVFDFKLESEQGAPKRRYAFDYLINKAEYDVLERCMASISGKKKKTVAANSDVDPEKDQ